MYKSTAPEDNTMQAHIACVLFPAPYVKQCQPGDPKMAECIIGALHHLRPYLAKGNSGPTAI
jgi:hypothetical protein